MASKIGYYLRTRVDDKDNWSEPELFSSRKERDKASAFCRCIGGLRTHSYEERIPKSARDMLTSNAD